MFNAFKETFSKYSRELKKVNTWLLLEEHKHELYLINGLIERTPADYTERGGITQPHSLLDLLQRKAKVEAEIKRLSNLYNQN